MKDFSRHSARQYAQGLAALQEDQYSHAAELIRGLVTLLQKKRSLFLLRQILTELQEIEKEQQGIVEVAIETAHDLPEKVRKYVHAEAEKMYPGKKVHATISVQPELLAGFRIRGRDKERDQSLRTALYKLRNQLTHV